MPTYKHGDKWRTIVTFNYKQKSKVTRTKREGEIWEAEILRELSKSEEEKKDSVTLRYVFEKYRDEVTPTKRGKRWEHIRIEAFLKSTMPLNEPVHTIEPNHIGKWRDERLLTVSAGTILRDFALLSAIFEHARKEWQFIEVNPIRDVKKPREPDHRDIIISRAQIKQLLKAMGYKPNDIVKSVSQAVACCFIVALRTGMRAGELTSLTWKNVKDDYTYVTAAVDTTFSSTVDNAAATPAWVRGLALIKNGTAVATTSAAAYDFSIPAGVKRVTFIWSQGSTASTGIPMLQIGVSTPTTTGYDSTVSATSTAGTTAAINLTSGFAMVHTGSGAAIYKHVITIVNISGNTWVCGVVGSSTSVGFTGSGTVTLSGVLGVLRLTTTSGTDTFDAGTANVFWEF